MVVAALYRKGPAWDEERTLGEQEGVAEHIGYLTRLYRDGLLRSAGPFHRYEDRIDEELVGLVIFQADAVEQAQALTADDPAVRRGLLVPELRPWYP